MQNITYFLFWVLWPLLSKRIMPTCRTFDDKVHSWLLFWDIVKILQTFYWVLWEWLIVPINDDSIALEETLMPKVLKSTCSQLWCLSAYQKLTSSLTFFFGEILQRHCKLAILGTLGMLCHTHENHSIDLWPVFMLIYMQKNNFIIYFYLETLQKNRKLVILGNLGITGHTHLKWKYQFEETFDV